MLTAASLYRKALLESKGVYLFGTFTLLVTSVTEVLMPKFVQWSIDLIGGKTDTLPQKLHGASTLASLHNIVIVMACAMFIGFLGRIGWRQLLARQTHLVGRRIKIDFWDALCRLPVREFQRWSLGDLMNRATGDWNVTRSIHGFTVVLTLDLIFFTILAVISMFLIDVQMTLACLIVFPFLPRVITRIARKEHDLHAIAQNKLGDLSDKISQALSTIRMQRATNSGQLWQKGLAGEARDYANKRFEVVKTGWRIFPLGAFPTLVAYGVLLVWGVHKIHIGALTIGEFVALQSYVLMLQGPLFDMGDCIAEWQTGFASFKRIVEVLRMKTLGDQFNARAKVADNTLKGPLLAVKGLNFTFPESERKILTGINLTIGAGARVGILGSIGSGKSTLMSLIAGLVDPPPGTMFLQGVDLVEAKREFVTDLVAVVPQKSFLFAGSIRFNLMLDQDYSDEKLWKTLETVCLDQDIRLLKEGLDTWIGEWGINLSGGQKQRLALARALIRKKPLLLLDDCLSAVDAVTEERILTNLDRELHGLTVIWVAHRMSTLKKCSEIYEMDAGQLTALQGTKLVTHGVEDANGKIH
jgi:ATP-binding cassette subfamily B multidrug efflux pump